jgi:Cu-Zn family superoxide dismutase
MRRLVWFVGATILVASGDLGCRREEARRPAERPSASPALPAPAPAPPAAPAAKPPPVTERAFVEVRPTARGKASGTLTFALGDKGVHLTGTLVGLTPGLHGFHVHEKGDCSAPDAKSAGEHFNPGNRPHGGPDTPADRRHAGDLGNIEADKKGKAHVDMTIDRGLLETGERGILGRALVVHAERDDLTSQPSGAAGDRVGCGVIVRAEPGKM